MATVPVAVCQFATGTDPEVNRSTTIEAIARAAAGGARLAITPENSMYADPKRRYPESYSEPLDGPFVSAVSDACRQARVHAVVGIAETLQDDERVSNTLVALGPDGGVVGVYRKVHLYDAFGYRESERVRPADPAAPLVFDLDGVRFGAFTCYDLRFPESARTLVDAGASALLLPAAWAVGPAKEDHWSTLIRARAIENTSYVLAAAQSGPYCTGQSLVVDPMGTVVACAGEQPGTVRADVDAERVRSVREKNPSLANRRYRVLPQEDGVS